MLRFSCFNGHMSCHKPKKSAHPPLEAVSLMEGSSKIKVLENSASSNPGLSTLHADGMIDKSSNGAANSFSSERGWKSEEMESKVIREKCVGALQTGHLKKSQSVGSGLDCKGRMHTDYETECEMEREFSFDGFDEHSRSVTLDVSNKPSIMPFDKYRKDLPLELCQAADAENDKSIFSIGDPQNSDKEGLESSEVLFSGENAVDSGEHTPRTFPELVRSQSLPKISISSPNSPNSGEYSKECSRLQAKSCEELRTLGMSRTGISIHELKVQLTPQEERNYDGCKGKDVNNGDAVTNGYHYPGSASDWVIDETSPKPDEGESSGHHWDDLPNKDFKLKRIENWVFDLQPCTPLEGVDESIHPNDQNKREHGVLSGLTATKVDSKVTVGMEAAKRYISSLSASAATVQLSNHGLTVIPFLSAFVSLKVLNLSGNNIARITAGALPRGLHMLNLSKNQISAIEGLRELNRLRVLDLSYNKIVRIGHGLASCSSLKELYLAGNKISEVEGLHRLLKLNVLDLRFNKISTAKCLGQLAANYNSLQAICLEGNPAQKNVGDDHIKKYLQGLLPHLAYYNRQLIKAGTSKDVADRSVRLGVNAHQFDRGLRSEHKSTRKVAHGVVSKSSSSSHGRRSQAVTSPKHSKGKHVRLPPSGTKGTAHHHQQYNFDFNDKLRSLREDLLIRKSRSEGNLGVL